MREPAEHSRSAPALRPGLAAAVHGLPWLAPGVSSLVSLARPVTHSTWNAIRHDPGAVLLLLRSNVDPSTDCLPRLLSEPACLELALRHLDDPIFLDWMGIIAAPVYRFAVRAASVAARLATITGRADVEAARVCGLLAPLGWMAVCAIDPTAAEACLSDSEHADDPVATQQRWWGLDSAAIARRLARRWRLPGWLALGRLNLPGDAARSFAADADLLHLTRVAVGIAQREGPSLGLVDTASVATSAAELGVDVSSRACECVDSTFTPPREDPKSQPLLRDLLATAAENRRLQSTPRQDCLEDEADLLHCMLEDTERVHATRLREEKLTALAEFAAGAGHEINNPLAVILGQAQYLLGHEAEWFTPDPEQEAHNSLQKIVGQTRRIHGLLRDLMQFARPAPPAPAWHDLPQLIGEVAASLAGLAEERQVRVTVEVSTVRQPVFLDAAQTKLALSCLLRNAIEAAPHGGQARLSFDECQSSDTFQVVVEDSGPGPDPAVRSSLFDPFYSGRSAGRGRGLGLPTAWRLARQQGGDVRLEVTHPGEPTRFVLTLPRIESPEGSKSLSLVESILAAPLPAAAEATNGRHSA